MSYSLARSESAMKIRSSQSTRIVTRPPTNGPNWQNYDQVNRALHQQNTIKKRKNLLSHIVKRREQQRAYLEMEKIKQLNGTLQRVKDKFLSVLHRSTKESAMDNNYFMKYSHKKKDSNNILSVIGQMPNSEEYLSVVDHIIDTKLKDERDPERRQTLRLNMKQNLLQNRRKTLMMNDQAKQMRHLQTVEEVEQQMAKINKAQGRMQTGSFQIRSMQKSRSRASVIKGKQILMNLTVQHDGVNKRQTPETQLFFRPILKKNIKVGRSNIRDQSQRRKYDKLFDAFTQQQQQNKDSPSQTFIEYPQEQIMVVSNESTPRVNREREKTLLFCSNKIFVRNGIYSSAGSQRDMEGFSKRRIIRDQNVISDDGNVSLASYTETKLDVIYSRSIQLQKDIQKLQKMVNKNGVNRMDVYLKEQLRVKSIQLRESANESLRLLYRKQSQ